MPSATFFSWLYLLAAGAALMAASVMWARRDAAGARPLALMMLAAAWWAVADAIELHVATVAAKRVVSQIQYVGVVAAAPLFLHAAMALARRAHELTPRLLVAIWAIPLVSLGMAWTSAWHGFLWSDIRLPQDESPFATYEYGPWFWALTLQHYALMVAASVVLLRAMANVGRGFRAGIALVLLAVLLPWAGNAAYNLKVGPWPGLNWLTLSLGISGWLLVWVVLREGLLDLLPRARTVLLEMMSDAVVLLDRQGGILYSNQTARDGLRLDAPALAGALGVTSLTAAPVDWQGESRVDVEGRPRWLDIRVGPVFDRWGDLAGRLIVARDVTIQKELEDERERLVDELQDALRRVTSLEGMLPICAQCRNVRDDHGYWNRIEDYFGTRTPLEFTHAICPDCMTRVYSDVSTPAGAEAVPEAPAAKRRGR